MRAPAPIHKGRGFRCHKQFDSTSRLCHGCHMTGANDLNIRDFPVELHRQAKARAAQETLTLRKLVIAAVAAYLESRGDVL